jgi:hypothetical protein
MNEYKVFFFGRPLQTGDVVEAVNKFGGVPALAVLSPVNESFKSELPDETIIDIRVGLLKSELWLADQPVVSPVNRWAALEKDSVEKQLNHIIDVFKETDSPCIIPDPGKMRGRPQVNGPYMSRTTRWRRRKELMKQQEAMI